jgi:hypothetical protein
MATVTVFDFGFVRYPCAIGLGLFRTDLNPCSHFRVSNSFLVTSPGIADGLLAPFNQWVAGSNPARATKKTSLLAKSS